MIVARGSNFFWLLRDNAARIVAVVAITAVTELANNHLDLDRPTFSQAAVSLLVTALSIFLVFRVNEAYRRWWEARMLWGSIVNDSRSFCRQVLSLLRPVTADEAGRQQLMARATGNYKRGNERDRGARGKRRG